MESIPVEPAAFWYLVGYILIRDAIIPLALKIFPARQEQSAVREKREQEIEAREVNALETIGQTLIKLNDRQVTSETNQSVLLSNQAEHSKALAILVDRVAREETIKPIKTRKAVK